VESQEAVPGSTLNLYRDALRIRNERLKPVSPTLIWEPTERDVLGVRRDGWFLSLTNLSLAAVELPTGSEVLLTSGPLTDDGLPPDTTVWLLTQP
jgi:alpha-glucosidase